MVLLDRQHIRALLADAVTSMCKNTLSYQVEVQVEGLIGITIDQKDIVLVSINENLLQSKSDDPGTEVMVRELGRGGLGVGHGGCIESLDTLSQNPSVCPATSSHPSVVSTRNTSPSREPPAKRQAIEHTEGIIIAEPISLHGADHSELKSIVKQEFEDKQSSSSEHDERQEDVLDHLLQPNFIESESADNIQQIVIKPVDSENDLSSDSSQWQPYTIPEQSDNEPQPGCSWQTAGTATMVTRSSSKTQYRQPSYIPNSSPCSSARRTSETDKCSIMNMGKNQFDRAVATTKKLMNKFADWGLTTGFVYTTKDGLQFYGSEAVGHVINQNQGSITSHPTFAGRMNRAMLPTLNKPLQDMSYLDLRELAVLCVRSEHVGVRRKLGWGKPEIKPVWWPASVPWTKRGVNCGVTMDQMRVIIQACYTHRQQPLIPGGRPAPATAPSPAEAPRRPSPFPSQPELQPASPPFAPDPIWE